MLKDSAQGSKIIIQLHNADMPRSKEKTQPTQPLLTLSITRLPPVVASCTLRTCESRSSMKKKMFPNCIMFTASKHETQEAWTAGITALHG